MSRFTEDCEIDQYGAYWPKAHTNERGHKTLIVFVHGICGSFRGTWRNLPKLFADRISNTEMFLYSYLSYPWNHISIQGAASQLRGVLNEQYSSTRDIIFVTHSTGGLVVKELFRQERRAAEAESARAGYFDRLPIIARCRWIMNVAVPHAGGSFTLTLPVVGLYTLSLPISVVLWFISFLSFGKLRLGFNSIIYQLFYRNRWLRTLDIDNQCLIDDCIREGIPVPSVTEILSDQDKALPAKEQYRWLDRQQEPDKVEARGTHGAIGGVEKYSDLIMKACENRLDWLPDRSDNINSNALDLEYAELILARVRRLLEASNGNQLIGEGAGETETGSQRDAYIKVMEYATKAGAAPRKMLLTGDAGVGKSITLAHVARDLAVHFLSSLGTNAPFPILIPMQQASLSPKDLADFSREDPWEILSNIFVNEVSKLIDEETEAGNGKTRNTHGDMFEWLVKRCTGKPTVIIFDGVDDFLMNHPYLGIDNIQALLRSLETSFSNNQGLCIVLGMRSTHPGTREIGLGAETVQISRMTVTQAENHFPGCGAALQNVDDQDARELLLTPLVLSKFKAELTATQPNLGDNRAAILEKTMLHIVVSSGVMNSPALEELQTTHSNLSMDLMDALMTLGWTYFKNFRGEMSLEQISTEISALREPWQHADLRFLDLISDREILKVLCERTVFLSIGDDRFRFSHRTWEEYLVARYIAHCIRHGIADELGVRSLNQQILQASAVMLGDMQIGKDLVQVIYDRAKETKNHVITGNFGALICNMGSAIDGHAFSMICERVFENEFFAGRHITIIGLAARALRADQSDNSASFLRDAVVPELRNLASNAHQHSDAHLASDAYCHLKALERKFGGSHTDGLEWKWPLAENEIREHALREAWVHTDDPMLNLIFRSIQMALVQILRQANIWPTISISAVHHLLAVVEARHRRVHFSDVEGELREVFEDDSPLELAVRESCAELSPETIQLFADIKKIYRGEDL